MNNLGSSQLKGLSEFLNTVAATWFSAGIISPIFIESENLIRTLVLSGTEILLALLFLRASLLLLRKVKL